MSTSWTVLFCLALLLIACTEAGSSSRSVSKSSATARSGKSAQEIAANAVCKAFTDVRDGADVYVQAFQVAKAFGKATAEALATASTFTSATGDARANAAANAKGVAIAEIVAKAFAKCIVKVCGKSTEAQAEAKSVIKDVQTAVAEAESKVQAVKGADVEAVVDTISKAVAQVSGSAVANVLLVVKNCKVTIAANADTKTKVDKVEKYLYPAPKKTAPKQSPKPYYKPKQYYPPYEQPKYYKPSPSPSPKYQKPQPQYYDYYDWYNMPQYYAKPKCPTRKCMYFGERMCCGSTMMCKMMKMEYVYDYECPPYVKLYGGDQCYCDYY
eukprot:TRINITY_DN37464_c0_g2_i7.p2 TRINITY_DN37464_c0_g2~~TRINITY_DN37464_c0_g2_i7.p2  ORF type:complete len:327 (+),score=52.93 TRINITY_DN37464_c0_g2_i7:231-1211(+)